MLNEFNINVSNKEINENNTQYTIEYGRPKIFQVEKNVAEDTQQTQ